MPPAGRQSLFEALRRFRDAWVSHGWSWDRRFECVASTFDVERSGEARAAAAELFISEWTHRTLQSSPPVVANVAEMTGGVRADQLLLSTDEMDGLIAYGLWWPWGAEGTNISMRVGLAGNVEYSDSVQLRTLFGTLDD